MMTFEQIINHLTTSTKTQDYYLQDGQIKISYQALRPFFEQLDHYFAASQITPADCLTLECPNTVPGAITLVYLLSRGYGLMLTPPAGPKEAALELKPLPQFSRYRLRLNPTTSLEPAKFLAVTENEAYQPSLQPTEGKLFLRTSGSMGISKIVVHQQTKLVGNAQNCQERFRITSADRVTLPVPIFHMYGLGAGFLPAVMAGASIDLQENTNILKYLPREQQFDPTIAFFTPSLCEMLLKGKKNPRPYKTVVTAGARINETLFREFAARFGGLVNLYGSTEMGAVAAAEPDDPIDIRATTIGKPMNNVCLELRSSEEEVSSKGELYCQHAYGFEEYINEAGQHLSRAERWYQTGDLAERLPDGLIKVLGRLGNSINRRGYLILFSDVERAMEKIAELEQVVVVRGKQETDQGVQLVAFCVLKRGATLNEAELRQRCFDYLPKYAIPDNIYLLKTLPTLASGKINRRALAEILK